MRISALPFGNFLRNFSIIGAALKPCVGKQNAISVLLSVTGISIFLNLSIECSEVFIPYSSVFSISHSDAFRALPVPEK